MAKYVSLGQLQGQIRKSFESLKLYMDTKIRDPVTATAQQAKALADEVVRRADSGEFKGDTGAQGPRGEKGDTGETGATGATGAPGINGTDGDDGTTFTPAVSAAGVISWTNDGGKSNPPSVDLAAAAAAAVNVHPTAKTADMTQAVGKDSDGLLWTLPGGGGSEEWELGADITTTEAGTLRINFPNSYSELYGRALLAEGVTAPSDARLNAGGLDHIGFWRGGKRYQIFHLKFNGQIVYYEGAGGQWYSDTYGYSDSRCAIVLPSQTVSVNYVEFWAKDVPAGTNIKIWGKKA